MSRSPADLKKLPSDGLDFIKRFDQIPFDPSSEPGHRKSFWIPTRRAIASYCQRNGIHGLPNSAFRPLTVRGQIGLR